MELGRSWDASAAKSSFRPLAQPMNACSENCSEFKSLPSLASLHRICTRKWAPVSLAIALGSCEQNRPPAEMRAQALWQALLRNVKCSAQLAACAAIRTCDLVGWSRLERRKCLGCAALRGHTAESIGGPRRGSNTAESAVCTARWRSAHRRAAFTAIRIPIC